MHKTARKRPPKNPSTALPPPLTTGAGSRQCQGSAEGGGKSSLEKQAFMQNALFSSVSTLTHEITTRTPVHFLIVLTTILDVGAVLLVSCVDVDEFATTPKTSKKLFRVMTSHKNATAQPNF